MSVYLQTILVYKCQYLGLYNYTNTHKQIIRDSNININQSTSFRNGFEKEKDEKGPGGVGSRKGWKFDQWHFIRRPHVSKETARCHYSY